MHTHRPLPTQTSTCHSNFVRWFTHAALHTQTHTYTHPHTCTHTQATANPDLMDDLYLLGNRVVTYSPRLFLDNSVLSSVPAAQNSTAAGAAGGRYEGVQTSLLGASYPCLPAFQGTQTFLQSCIFIRTLSCIVSHTGMRRYC